MAQDSETMGELSLDNAWPTDAVDPELVALPAPPQGRRVAAMILMALTVVASCAMLTAVASDAEYFFADPQVSPLGHVSEVSPARLPLNAYVSLEGNPMLSNMVEYQRIFSGSEYVVFPLAGQRDVFVEMPAAMASDPTVMAAGSFSGRLVTMGGLGNRYAEVRSYLAKSMDLPVTSETFLLRVGEEPSSNLWALLVAAMCLLFVALNVGLFVRWFRPIPVSLDE